MLCWFTTGTEYFLTLDVPKAKADDEPKPAPRSNQLSADTQQIHDLILSLAPAGKT